MKKCAILILALVMICSVFAISYAETVNLSQMSDNEILSLLTRVQQEIVNRRIEKSATLPAGSYLVGKDLPAGSYTLYCKYDGSWWVDIYVKANGGDGDTVFEATVFGPDNAIANTKSEGTWTITLEDGQLLKCTSEITLTISAGIRFY